MALASRSLTTSSLLLFCLGCNLTFDVEDYPYQASSLQDQGVNPRDMTPLPDLAKVDMTPPKMDMAPDLGEPDLGQEDMTPVDLGQEDMAPVDMAPPAPVQRLAITEIMIKPEDDNTEEWVEILNLTNDPLPLSKIRFVVWGSVDDLSFAPVTSQSAQYDSLLSQARVPASIPNIPANEHLVILKNEGSQIDESVQVEKYNWLAFEKGSAVSFQLSNNPTDWRSIAIYYLEPGNVWTYQASLSWKKGGLFALSAKLPTMDNASLSIGDQKSWSVQRTSYPPTRDTLTLDDWCIDISDELTLSSSGNLKGSPGYINTSCAPKIQR